MKEYTNGEVTVVWESGKCIHSANCVKGLPLVFQPTKRPWIMLENADTQDIVNTVKNCPSGALTYRMNMENEKELTGEISAADIKLLSDGPLMVSGKFTITDQEGNVLESRDKVALCRCGASANKPFCDGAHRQAGFKG